MEPQPIRHFELSLTSCSRCSSSLISAYHEAGDLELVETLESHRRELADAADDDRLAVLAESCLEAARAAVARACDRQSEQHAELTRFVALVRDTVTVLGGEGQDPSTEINRAADRFNELLEDQGLRSAQGATGDGGDRTAPPGRGASASVARCDRGVHGQGGGARDTAGRRARGGVARRLTKIANGGTSRPRSAISC